MRAMILSHSRDIEDTLRHSRYSHWVVTTHEMHLGNHDEVLEKYRELKPSLVIIDAREGPGTGRHDAIRNFEQSHGLQPVTMQYVHEDEFKAAIARRNL